MRTKTGKQSREGVMSAQTEESGRSSYRRRLILYMTIIVVTGIVTCGLAEIYLRLVFSEGLSFARHYGPLVRQFERDFQFNRFDGPSRGPDVTGPKGENVARVLIQGDSITWGQGVKDERALYPSLLRDRLRSINPAFEVAVLARPGREIDGHLEQLRKWGDEIDPDVIIYQWFVNDVEIDKGGRPPRDPIWQRVGFPGFATNRSYLWFFLDYRLDTWLYRDTYDAYLHRAFGKGTPGWRAFAEQFHAWATEAKRLTPYVLVTLYPYLPPSPDLLEFHTWVRELSEQEGIAVIDLVLPLDRFRDDYTQAFASRFDAHPGVAAHEQIANALYGRLLASWPQVFHPVSTGQRTASGSCPADVDPPGDARPATCMTTADPTPLHGSASGLY